VGSSDTTPCACDSPHGSAGARGSCQLARRCLTGSRTRRWVHTQTRWSLVGAMPIHGRQVRWRHPLGGRTHRAPPPGPRPSPQPRRGAMWSSAPFSWLDKSRKPLSRCDQKISAYADWTSVGARAARGPRPPPPPVAPWHECSCAQPCATCHGNARRNAVAGALAKWAKGLRPPSTRTPMNNTPHEYGATRQAPWPRGSDAQNPAPLLSTQGVDLPRTRSPVGALPIGTSLAPAETRVGARWATAGARVPDSCRWHQHRHGLAHPLVVVVVPGHLQGHIVDCECARDCGCARGQGCGWRACTAGRTGAWAASGTPPPSRSPANGVSTDQFFKPAKC